MWNTASEWARGTTTCSSYEPCEALSSKQEVGFWRVSSRREKCWALFSKTTVMAVKGAGMQGIKRRSVQELEIALFPRGSSHGAWCRSPPAWPTSAVLVNTLPETFQTALSNSRRVRSRVCLRAQAHPSLIGDSCPEVRPKCPPPTLPITMGSFPTTHKDSQAEAGGSARRFHASRKSPKSDPYSTCPEERRMDAYFLLKYWIMVLRGHEAGRTKHSESGEPAHSWFLLWLTTSWVALDKNSDLSQLPHSQKEIIVFVMFILQEYAINLKLERKVLWKFKSRYRREAVGMSGCVMRQQSWWRARLWAAHDGIQDFPLEVKPVCSSTSLQNLNLQCPSKALFHHLSLTCSCSCKPPEFPHLCETLQK